MHQMDANLYDALNCPHWTIEELNFALHIIAVGVLFRILDQDASADVVAPSSEHPHPAVRCCFATSCAMTRAALNDRLTPQAGLKMAFEITRNIEDVWAELMLLGQRVMEPETFGERVGNEMWTLFAEYRRHADDLNRYARVPRDWCDWEMRD